ncbi:hypothetical protein BGZ65_006856 [Modicella reniformis]|uniref:Uncharacterized protein n=1 Tax=Modicella reniformis TaxID=1440133 RepID=A0A9P6SSR0_9FUNG|nr:hypothetical protein BGZ65_006856 [Modicella reniformis]
MTFLSNDQPTARSIPPLPAQRAPAAPPVGSTHVASLVAAEPTSSSSTTGAPAVLPARGYVEIAPRSKNGAAEDIEKDEDFLISYYHQSAEDIYNEYKRYREYRANRKSLNRPEIIQPKVRKQLSNRKFIVMEIEYIQQQGIRGGLTQEQALVEAFNQLTSSMSTVQAKKKWSINRVVEYCRVKVKERESRGNEERKSNEKYVVQDDVEEEEEEVEEEEEEELLRKRRS